MYINFDSIQNKSTVIYRVIIILFPYLNSTLSSFSYKPYYLYNIHSNLYFCISGVCVGRVNMLYNIHNHIPGK